MTKTKTKRKPKTYKIKMRTDKGVLSFSSNRNNIQKIFSILLNGTYIKYVYVNGKRSSPYPHLPDIYDLM